jgi:hypothetical protein
MGDIKALIQNLLVPSQSSRTPELEHIQVASQYYPKFTCRQKEDLKISGCSE